VRAWGCHASDPAGGVRGEAESNLRVRRRALGRAWAARQPETTGDNTNQPVGKPQVKSNSYANPKVTESARTDYGSEGWGFESLRAC
jgi:hypothetical protein